MIFIIPMIYCTQLTTHDANKKYLGFDFYLGLGK